MAMGFTFDFYRITMAPRYLIAPALCYAALALAHAFVLTRLILYCVWNRRFTFDVHLAHKGDWNQRLSTLFKRFGHTRYAQWREKLSLVITRIFSRQGFLGIESEYFELVYIMREVLETALQSVQAYEMSLTVSRGYLSEFVAIMIFINCWSTPIVLHHFAHYPPLARLVCLVLDIGLDFVSTVLAPLVLVLPYFQYYDSVRQDFTPLIWYDDVLLVKAVNEFRLVMITTWPELATRMLFSVSMLMCLESAKSLLCPYRSKIQIQQICTSSPKHSSTTSTTRTVVHDHIPSTGAEPLQSRFSIVLATIMHVFFMTWGLAVLAIYIQAATHIKLSGCALQVHPWFATKSACALMYINCKYQQTDGKLEDLDAFMLRMDEHSLVHIVIRHCPNVEIPPRVQTFPQLVGMKIYNSTLAGWDNDAALTRHHHPNMVFLFLVDVNMTQIPDGLLSEAFPRQLRDIEISGTNLTHLPEVLDQRWDTHGFIAVELCQFQAFPNVLSRMKVSILVIGSNEINAIPGEFFTNLNPFMLVLSNNPIGSLPAIIPGAVSAKFLLFDHTELSALPSWVDEALLEETQIHAVGTYFCDQVQAAARAEYINRNISKTYLRAYQAGALQCDQVSSVVSPYYPRSLEAVLDEQFANA